MSINIKCTFTKTRNIYSFKVNIRMNLENYEDVKHRSCDNNLEKKYKKQIIFNAPQLLKFWNFTLLRNSTQ